MKKLSKKIDSKVNLLKEFGKNINNSSTILDFGCGNGKSVKVWRDIGVQAFGCDIKFNCEDEITKELLNSNQLKKIQLSPYHLPFQDNTFDVVYSDQVFEHVQNYKEVISELYRVTKPNGVCLHIFPSRYMFIEPHVYVPLATIIRNYYWLLFWAKCGIKNEYQLDLSSKEIAIKNLYYLKNNTKYYSKKKLIELFTTSFNIKFCEKEMLKYGRGGKFKFLLKIIPFLDKAVSTFRVRVLLTIPKK